MVRERLGAVLCSILLLLATGCGNGARPSDETIVTWIQGKMFSEPALKASTISVKAKDGVVTLSGQLPDEAARETAQKIASEALGVSKVMDRTTVAVQQAAVEAALTTVPVAPVAIVRARPEPAAKPVRAAAPPAKKSAPPQAAPAQLAPEPSQPQNADDSQRRVISRNVIPPPAAPSEPVADPGPIAMEGSPTAVAPSAPVASVPPPKPQAVIVRIPRGSRRFR